MGNQELLEAARTGNIQQLEKQLGGKNRKPSGEKGPLTSAFQRFHNLTGFGLGLANIQCADPSGETPLHLAALNGHRDAVQLLLQYEALTNATDEQGCMPLHLAAWTGRSDICDLLLQPSSVPVQINAQNITGDTALHCASQHGHCGTVSILLQDGADPTIRNLANDSPLDFAAQYGRADVVKQLLTMHPTLIKHHMTDHSPLHRASRAGHTVIVKYLLDAGFSVNLMTDVGSPLHEASRYCKVDVIKLLLERGVDVTVRDKVGMSAIEILSSLPSQKAHDAVCLIKDHMKKQAILYPIDDRTPSEDEYSESSSEQASPVKPVPAPRASIYTPPSNTQDNIYSLESDPKQYLRSPDISPPPIPPRIPSFVETRHEPVIDQTEIDDDVYDVPPPLATTVSSGNSTSSVCSETSSIYSVPVQHKVHIPPKPPRASKLVSMNSKSRLSTSPNNDPLSSEKAATECDECDNEYIDMSLMSKHENGKAGQVEHVTGNEEKKITSTDAQKECVPSSDVKITGTDIQKECVPSTEVKITATDIQKEYVPSTEVKITGTDIEKECVPSTEVKITATDIQKECVPSTEVKITSSDETEYANTSAFTTLLKQEGCEVREELVPGSEVRNADELVTEESKVRVVVEDIRERDPDGEVQKDDVPDSEVQTTNTNDISCDSENNEQTLVSNAQSNTKDLQINVGIVRSSDLMANYDQVRISYSTAGVKSAGNTETVKENGEKAEKAQKPSFLPLESNRTSIVGEDIPLSPSSYVQPPTPDHPPPSPMTAEKRKSKDMETLTDSYLLADGTVKVLEKDPEILIVSVPEIPPTEKSDLPPPTIPDMSESLSVKTDRCHSQVLETVPEKVEENGNSSENRDPSGGDNSASSTSVNVEMRQTSLGGDSVEVDSRFAGLLRGSTPGGSRNVVSQICEKVAVRHVKTKRSSTPSTFFTFDPLMEKEEDKDIDTEEVLRAIDAIEATAKHAAENKHDESSAFDDSEEWAKIEETLAGFGAPMARESVFVREYEADFERLLAASANSKMQSVGDWLDRLGMGQYENTLVANGYDDTDFLGGKVLEDADLEGIGIKDANHRKKILEAAKKLPMLTPIDQERLIISVKDWLVTLRLEHYLDTFNSHKYNTMQRVIKLWELELSTVLDITSIGHRKRILESLGNRPPPEKRDSSNSSPALVKKEVHEPHEVKNIPDLFKDYTGVKSTAVDEGEVPIPTQNPLLMFEKNEEFINKQGQHIHDSSIHIRPPHLAHTTGSVRQWRHRPEILIKGCCNYTAQYLGSTLVKDLNGPGSTQEGISKLKQRLRRKLQKSSDVIAKIPTIMLSISYKGVKFIDAKSKRVICDHEIANIFCACQDAEHLNFFAYITKDRETEKHYCHVFSVRSRELAGEIILTLGEAFEIAYQMALKEKAEEDALDFERQLSQNDPDDTASLSSKTSVNTM